MEIRKKTKPAVLRDSKAKDTFNQSEFNANKEAFSCCYSGLFFYYPKRVTR
ncbi:MAG: hypothetical protein IKS32_13875 [Solobacterium sp.]|jgi:hypothetical protein|nr:hypothetical protein [Solobacterium sp.]